MSGELERDSALVAVQEAGYSAVAAPDQPDGPRHVLEVEVAQEHRESVHSIVHTEDPRATLLD